MQTLWRTAAMLLLMAGTGASAETWRVATGELPPYFTEGRADQGVSLNLLRQALRKQGVEVEYTFLPWSRAQEETRAGKWDATAAWGRRADRERDFLLSNNVLVEQWVVLHRAALKFDWRSADDLQGYSMAALRVHTYTPQIVAMLADGRLKADWTPDDLSALQKLAAGRVDLMILDRNVACYLMERHLSADQIQAIRFHPRLITDNFTTHVMLPRQDPRSAERLAIINRALAFSQAGADASSGPGLPECHLASGVRIGG